MDKLERRQQIDLIRDMPKTCPSILNDEKKSMGLVEPEEIHDAYLERIDDPEPAHTDLTSNTFKSKRSYPHKLYIEYTCGGCAAKGGKHRQHCIEWGTYRFWDKNPEISPDQVIENYHLLDDDYRSSSL